MPEGKRRRKTPAGAGSCIWSKAGVAKERVCRNDYDCVSCRYDAAMRSTAEANARLRSEGKTPSGKKARIVPWQDKIREMPAWRRPCIHHLKGKIEFRACSNEYSCTNCEFDQYFMDEFSVRAIVRPVDLLEVKGISIPQGYYLHRGHGWAKIEEGNTVRIGIDDFAGRVFGSFSTIETPLIGKAIRQGEDSFKLITGTEEARMMSPVSGVVVSTNNGLREKAECVSMAPYADGWFVTVHATALRQDLKRLMINKEASGFIGKELEALYRAIEESGGPLAADGGFIAPGLISSMHELDWNKMRKRFLRT